MYDLPGSFRIPFPAPLKHTGQVKNLALFIVRIRLVAKSACLQIPS
jgi:hypothetical protein